MLYRHYNTMPNYQNTVHTWIILPLLKRKKGKKQEAIVKNKQQNMTNTNVFKHQDSCPNPKPMPLEYVHNHTLKPFPMISLTLPLSHFVFSSSICSALLPVLITISVCHSGFSCSLTLLDMKISSVELSETSLETSSMASLAQLCGRILYHSLNYASLYLMTISTL